MRPGRVVTHRAKRKRGQVVRLPRNKRRYWRRKGRAGRWAMFATWVARKKVRWRGRGRVSAGVRIGRIVFFGFLAILVAVRVGDIGLGFAKPAFGCRVTGVIDGDTVHLVCSGQGAVRGRLLGFDTPEVYSPRCVSEYARGIAATQKLRWEIWKAREVKTIGFRKDRYGRRLVALFLDGRNAAGIMIGAGLSRPYAGGRRQGWCQ